MTVFLEWTDKVFTRNGTFLPTEEALRKTGFRSVYGFETKPESSKGLNQFPVYSDVLFLDFDDGMGPSFEKAVEFFKAQGALFSVYSSGSKGGHLHVAIEPMQGEHVPYSQSQYVKNNGLDCDLSLYRHSSLIRLPGTTHDKTGRRKELLGFFDGALVNVPYLTNSKFSKIVVNDDSVLHIALTRMANLQNNQPANGYRSLTLWSLSKHLADAGFSFDTSLELVHRINESWKQPKEESEVLRMVKEAYSK